MEFQRGDRIRKKNGYNFSNEEPVCTIERIEGQLVWLRETGTNINMNEIILDEHIEFKPGDKVMRTTGHPFENGEPFLTIEKVKDGVAHFKEIPIKMPLNRIKPYNEEEMLFIWNKDNFPLTGERVQLDPASNHYRELLEMLGRKGTILDHDYNNQDRIYKMLAGIRNDSINTWNMKIQFDDEDIRWVNLSDLKPLDEPNRDFLIVVDEYGEVRTIPMEEADEFERKIIQNGVKLEEFFIMNDEKREEMRKKAKELYG